MNKDKTKLKGIIQKEPIKPPSCVPDDTGDDSKPVKDGTMTGDPSSHDINKMLDDYKKDQDE